MVRTDRFVLVHLVVALVAHVTNIRQHTLLLTVIQLANAARRPFRARVTLEVRTLGERRGEWLMEAAGLRRRQVEWESLNYDFNPVVADMPVETNEEPAVTTNADVQPERLNTLPVLTMPAACQATPPKDRRKAKAAKPPKSHRKDTDREAKLNEAEILVRKQGASVRAAARLCGVPESTLRRRLKRQ
ncbi:MAG TPA: helix-turn-helix domain-containing protein [Gemmataceae bacterium]|nr:helix-turn-helix domain-containing protein [Gemmataceae bacterium]